MKQKLLAYALASGVFALSSTVASAAPTLYGLGRTTSVQLSNELVGALTQLNVTPTPLPPGVLREGVAVFPITSGQIDLANAKGEVIHSGGLTLTAGTTVVDLSQFIIDTTQSSGPVLTGLVKANGSVVGRIPLFTITLPSLTLPLSVKRTLTIPSAALILTDQAAEALNGAFNVTAFTAGIPVGTAKVVLNKAIFKKSQ